MNEIVVVCTIFYSSYNLLNMAVYRADVVTSSSAACGKLTNSYRNGRSHWQLLELPRDELKFRSLCGVGGKDCERDPDARKGGEHD